MSELHGHEYLKSGTRLLLGTPKSHRPQDEKTFLLVNDQLEELKSLDDLVGHVRLASRTDAQGFVEQFAALSKSHWRPLTKLESLVGQPTQFSNSKARLRVNGALTDDEQRQNGLDDPTSAA